MENPEIKAFEFSLFQEYPDLIHGVFLRSGGVSANCFDALNVGLGVGDDPWAVGENRRLILAKMGSHPAIFLNQVHGTNIHVLEEENRQTPIVADGVVTDLPGISLVIQVADCQAILLFDPAKNVIANVHSGWRGSVQNIIGNCLDVMTDRFKCSPKDIRAGICPSLGPCCSEFINYKDEIPETLWSYRLPGTSHFDFWALSCDQLMEKGVEKGNIEIMKICTRCNTDQFYSFRKEKKTGRFACVIALK